MTQSVRSRTKLAHKWQFEALGTAWSIEASKPLTTSTRTAISERIERFDKAYSRFRDDSSARAMATPGIHVFPDDFSPLFSLYKKMYELTEGRMTPFVGAVMEQAGYDKDYSFARQDIQYPSTMDDVSWDENCTLQTKKPLILDVGAAGKGYMIDIVAALLKEHAAAPSFVIDAGGDMRVHNTTERIGLEHPLHPVQVIGAVSIQNKSLCASAANRRAWRDLHHIYNAKTLQPVRDIMATWVVADSAMLADALATALFFVPPHVLQSEFPFEYVRINSHMQLDYSDYFKGKLFHESATR